MPTSRIRCGTVSQYSIDALSGALSPKIPATVAAGAFPIGVAVTPDGKSAYVTNLDGGTVSQYSIDPQSGALSPKIPATVTAGTQPERIAVSPDGKSAYITDFNEFGPGTVSQYSIDPQSGALSPKTPATVTAGSEPVAIAVTPLIVPTSKDQCKNGGWRNFPQFKNQGDCVSFVETGK